MRRIEIIIQNDHWSCDNLSCNGEESSMKGMKGGYNKGLMTQLVH